MRILTLAIFLAASPAAATELYFPPNPYDQIARDGERERDQIMRDIAAERAADYRAYQEQRSREIERRNRYEPVAPVQQVYDPYAWGYPRR